MNEIPTTVNGTFGHGWESMKKFFPELLLILFILILFSLPMGILNALVDKDSIGQLFLNMFNGAYGLVIMAPLHYGAAMLFLKAVRGEPFNVNEIFLAYRRTLQVILANLLVGVVVVLGFIMLIVPGVIFACKLSMVPYLVMDREMDAVEAFRKSWDMTSGHSLTIFWMGLLSFLIIIGGVILLVVGVIPAILWISLAFAGMYQSITNYELRITNKEHPAS